MKTGLIGTGNMGMAMMNGYIKAYPEEAANCYLYNIHPEKAKKLAEQTGMNFCETLAELEAASEMVILAVEPQNFGELLPLLAKWEDKKEKLFVSCAAGVSLERMEREIGEGCRIMRLMPNTPAKVGEGMTSLSPNANCSKADETAALHFLDSFGKARVVSEDLIGAVVGASGSCPAYTYMYIDAVAKACEKAGMSREDALAFTAQGVLGAAKMILETGEDPAPLVDAVCSPGGATIEAVTRIKASDFYSLLDEAITACINRSIELGKE